MGIREFLKDYFLNPMADRTGYNIYNTLVYGIIALVLVYIIFLALRKRIKIDENFFLYTLPFVVLGSTMRVLVDGNDAGFATFYPYTPLTTSPGIFFTIAFITLLSLFIGMKTSMKKYFYIGLALAFLHIALLFPLFKNYLFFIEIILLATLFTVPAILKFKSIMPACAVFVHSLDGSATFLTLDVFNKSLGGGYFEQHVFANSLNSIFGSFLPFLIVKIVFAYSAVLLISKEKMKKDEKAYLLLIITILGLAPGLRDSLRILCGV